MDLVDEVDTVICMESRVAPDFVGLLSCLGDVLSHPRDRVLERFPGRALALFCVNQVLDFLVRASDIIDNLAQVLI